MHAAELRRCLEDCDVAAIRRLWAHVSPHLPQPKTDADALVALHHARTQTKSIHLKLRAYSHRWLLDHGYPSGLPDQLKPSAERLYPRIVEGVMIAYAPIAALLKPVAPLVQAAMSDAVSEAYADGRTDPAHVKQRMNEARERTLDQLLGV